ncbi:MAG: precorrin-3B C(17)-methyltransferase [Rhodospirillales bacterium]|nr:precorrin-3B C(17)-methyltransferase [Rhodospirillales bacterium]
MSGWLSVVGLGPGTSAWLTPEAAEVLASATDIVGYATYVARVPAGPPGQKRHVSGNRVEFDRARHALELARAGHRVAVVSSGDPGVFAMAATVMEAVDTNTAAYASLDIRVCPGVTAMQAAASRVGAPLGHDFCAISLSDNLKPWDVVLKRLEAAAAAGFVLALYNPVSTARPWQLGEAFNRLRTLLSGSVPVVFARAIGHADERIQIVTLSDAEPGMADMQTVILIGTSETRLIPRPEGAVPFIYTPRKAAALR